jgi:1,4-dihydroxy-2-naphthoate octaprenyltransferase
MTRSVSVREWLIGARLRTLPLALAPLVLGAGSAHWAERFDLVMFLLCVVVALGLQIGVNFANDYSDGIRGTDDARVGPQRLTGSGAVAPTKVRNAAFLFFGIAALAGGVVIAVSGLWWLVVVGVLALIAAWFYTGGKNPYGYRGFGEGVVFLFFGLVATVGTAAVMVGEIPGETWFTGSAAGFFAAAVLLVNNIRDRETDAVAGKKTLAVRLGDKASRWFLVVMLLMPYVILALLSLLFQAAVFVFFTGIITAVVILIVLTAKKPQELITALGLISLNAVVFALGLGGAIAF